MRQKEEQERQKEEQERLKTDRAYGEFLKANVWEDIFFKAAARGFSGIHIMFQTQKWDKQAIEQQIRRIDFQGSPVTITQEEHVITVSWYGEHKPYIEPVIPAAKVGLTVKIFFERLGYKVIHIKSVFNHWVNEVY